MGFELTIAVLERAKTVRALDRSATAIGKSTNHEALHFVHSPVTSSLSGPNALKH
jgi:hypothetical protein